MTPFAVGNQRERDRSETNTFLSLDPNSIDVDNSLPLAFLGTPRLHTTARPAEPFRSAIHAWNLEHNSTAPTIMAALPQSNVTRRPRKKE